MCFFFCFCEISSLHLFYRFVYCKKSNPTFSSGDGEPEKAKQHFRPYFEAMAIRSNTKYIIIVVDIIYFRTFYSASNLNSPFKIVKQQEDFIFGQLCTTYLVADFYFAEGSLDFATCIISTIILLIILAQKIDLLKSCVTSTESLLYYHHVPTLMKSLVVAK